MADWNTITFNFDLFEPLRPPLEAALTGLELIEAILEALLAIIRPFLLDFLNPLKALIAALLAAIRAIINQIRATGLAVLLVHPDFSQPDFGAVLNSVSGAYPGFESKVVGKFFDTSDIFRPQYPPGSSVAMLILYIGADSPGDLLGLIFSLLSLIKHPIQLSGLPAPVGLKASPVFHGGDAVSQFRNLFDSDLDQSVSLEWRMPQAPAGTGVGGFIGQVVSFYNSFRFPNFIIERHGPFPQDEGQGQLDSRGEIVRIETESTTIGTPLNAIAARYDFPTINNLVPVREEDDTIHRIFNKKIAIQYGGDGEPVEGNPQGSNTSALAANTALIRGIATGTYRYLDEDPDLIPGRTYYYRVRAFFGDATDYLSLTEPNESQVKSAGLVRSGNRQYLRTSPKLTLGRPSTIVKAFVPRDIDTAKQAFQAYTDTFNAIRAGFLLNFDLPPATQFDDLVQQDQKTGWGTLGLVAGQIGAAKALGSRRFDDSVQIPFLLLAGSDLLKIQTDEIIQISANVPFNATARRLANRIVDKLLDNPTFLEMLTNQWSSGVNEIVNRTLDPESDLIWHVPAIIGGINPDVNEAIDLYLSFEGKEITVESITTTTTQSVTPGPYPLTGPKAITVEERLLLADFLRTALSVVGSNTSYLSWYSVTVGDLFPALTTFLFDFEQFLLALLKAINSALQEIVDIIETLLQKIRVLKQMLETILALLDLLNVNISLSVLSTSSTNGSATSLAQELITSDNKPGSSPFGLHSGMVFTAGGPGEGFVAALKVIGFILTLGQFDGF